MFATDVTDPAVRYASALPASDMRFAGVSKFRSANVSTATTDTPTKVFTAASTKVFTATAVAASTMATPTALGHRRLSAQIYQRAQCNDHCKSFYTVDRPRPTHFRTATLEHMTCV